MIFVG